ncbi:Golgi transport complex subunit 5-domain-containing protein [Cladochytrium replicatum]|nr:Golgi transport complex subunit 5-domain-containing protein [Cladochytrium replicatum]
MPIAGEPPASEAQWVDSILSQPEYKDFAADSFDARAYTNLVARAPIGNPYHGLDVSTVLARVSFSVDHLNKKIQELVAANYEELVQEITGLQSMDNVLHRVSESVAIVNNALERIKAKIKEPYEEIQRKTVQLERVQAASELLRKLSRFLYLVRRLDTEVSRGEPELSKVALTIYELESIWAGSDLSGIEVVERELPHIAQVKLSTIQQAETLFGRGMDTQTQEDIAAGLQVFHNLHMLASKTQEIVAGMVEFVGKAMRDPFTASTYDSVQGTNDPSGLNNAEAAQILWTKLEKTMDVMYEESRKVYLLERVLSRKKDPTTQVLFMNIVVKSTNLRMTEYFWRALSATFERELRSGTKGSPFLQQTLQNSYPKLLRLFHDTLSRSSVLTGPSEINSDGALLLRSIASFESVYHSKSLGRMLDSVNMAFPERLTGGLSGRHNPTRDDIDKILRTISSELDVAKFEGNLLRAIGKNAQRAINTFVAKCESLIGADSTAYQVSGSGPATPAQVVNLELINCSWFFQDGLWKIISDCPDGPVVDTLTDALKLVCKLVQSVAEPLMWSLTKELELIIVKIHKEDYGRGAKGSPTKAAEPASSQYMIELSHRLRWMQRELLSRLHCGDDSKQWIRSIGQRVVTVFLRHASIVRPLSESGKLKLASDMTQLEFALSQWFSGTGMKLETALAESYKALRGFRPLLFLDLSQLASAHHTAALPPIVLAHHLFVRGYPTLQLPTSAFNWTELQYSEWLDIHTNLEGLALLERCLDAYVDEVKRKGEKEFVVEYPTLRATVKSAMASIAKK